MTSALPPSAPKNTTPGTREGAVLPRWMRLYFTLAAITIATIASSVLITFHLARSNSASRLVAKAWAARSEQYERLADFAAAADRPGNDVFESGDPVHESAHLDSAVAGFRGELAKARADLQHNVAPSEAATLLMELDAMDSGMDSLVAQARQLFTYYQSGRSALAGRKMAAMDRSYDAVNSAIKRLGSAVDDIERRHIDAEATSASAMRKYEYAVALGSLLVVLGIVLYGRRLSRDAARRAEIRERNVVALSASEEKFRNLSEQLECRVDERTAELSAAIGALRESEQQMRESERQLIEAQRLSRVGSWEYDVDSGRVKWSDETFRQLGLDPTTVAPDFGLFIGALHADDRDRILRWIDEAARTGDMPPTEGRFVLAGGVTRAFRALGHVQRDEHGRAVRMTGTTQDVTAQKEVEASLRAARETAEAASQAKSEFLANMSHEIRTPMNGVLGMLELALDAQIDPIQRDYLETAHASAESLLDVINDILDFSKIEAGRFELDAAPFSPGEQLADTMSALAVRASAKGLELALEIHPDVPDELVGDLGRLRQVMVNLVGNAVKFTHRGEVVVSIGVESRDASGVQLHFRVSDTGIGIPEDKQRAVFEAFQQADTSITREFGGTGLGLAIAWRIVAMMGGRMWVESVPGAGSTFHFTARFECVALEKPRVDPADGVLEGIPVLVVDDNRTNLRILEQILLGWGMIPTLATSGQDALAVLAARHADGDTFSLILTDVDMPEMDGFALVEAIRGSSSLDGTTILMLSSARQTEEARRCRELGIDVYLTKPVRRTQLRQAIQRAVGGTANARESAQAAARTRTTAPAATDHSRPLHVLLAEDHPVNQKVTRSFLEREGHTVHVVSTGLQAVQAATRESFDAILMDVQMPEMGGFEATRLIRASGNATLASIPIIALTARAMKGDREACLAAGMTGYLSKPVRADELSVTLQTLARRGGDDAGAKSAEAGEAELVVQEGELLQMVQGDRALLRDMIALFLEDYPLRLSAMADSVRRADNEGLQFAAHSLKGAAMTLCAQRVARVALGLEELGRDGQARSAGAALAVLEREIGHARARLEEIAAA